MPVVTDQRAIVGDYIWDAPASDAGKPVFISFSFDLSPPTVYLPLSFTYTDAFKASFQPFTAPEQDAARAAFQIWDQVSGVHFFEVPSGMGDIQLASFDFALADPQAESFQAYAYFRTGTLTEAAHGIIFADSRNPTADTLLMLHEIGHDLGLKHPFEGAYTLPDSLDNSDTTVMSYTRSADAGPHLGTLDVSTITNLYGPNSADGSQDANWSWDAATHTLTQTGFDTSQDMRGVGGSNIIFAQGGDDTVEGTDGPDVMQGGSGQDLLLGYGNNDHLYGQSPNGGSDGADTIHGGDGSDYIQGNAGPDFLYGDAGSDRINGGADADLIMGGDGNDSVNGNLGNDTIDGGNGDDSLRGGKDDDQLGGGNGNDTLQGDLGNDTLTGGAGIDQLSGGDGADLFRFAPGDAAPDGQATDRITDFTRGADHLALGFQPVAVLIGTAADFAAADLTAQQLLAAHSGVADVAAIAVGTDILLFFSGSGFGALDSAIRLSGVATLAVDDFS